MKAKKIIIYIILIVTLLSIILSACVNNHKLTQRITIQSTDLTMNNEKLEESVRIIKSRLNNIDINEFKIKSIPHENKIVIRFTEELKIDDISPLLIQKGNLEFYTSFSRNEVKMLVIKNEELFSILKPDSLGSEIGSVPVAKMHEIQNLIDPLELENKCKFVWNSNDTILNLYALDPIPIVKGEDIENTYWEKIDNSGNNFCININLKQEVHNSWSIATRENIGKSIAIVLDNKVLATPVVRAEIINGKCRITGDFSEMESKRFAILMNFKLPYTFQIIL